MVVRLKSGPAWMFPDKEQRPKTSLSRAVSMIAFIMIILIPPGSIIGARMTEAPWPKIDSSPSTVRRSSRSCSSSLQIPSPINQKVSMCGVHTASTARVLRHVFLQHLSPPNTGDQVRQVVTAKCDKHIRSIRTCRGKELVIVKTMFPRHDYNQLISLANVCISISLQLDVLLAFSVQSSNTHVVRFFPGS